MNRRQRDIRGSILTSLRHHHTPQMAEIVLANDANAVYPGTDRSEVREVLDLMETEGEVYFTKSFADKRFYGILTPEIAARRKRECLTANDVEKDIVDAFNTLPRTERGRLLDKLRAIVDELDNA